MSHTPRIWSFGPVQLDERDMELVVAGRNRNLERRSKEVLIYLLEHAGEVVTKDELLDAVWADSPPTEAALAKCISRIRQALGDPARDLIHTAHGFGYRLIGNVTVAEAHEKNAKPLLLVGGAPVPQRSGWTLIRPLGKGGSGEAWLASHPEQSLRVIKFAKDLRSLASLKREISLSRVLAASAGQTAAFCRILDWNFEQTPYFIEYEYVANGNLQEWIDELGGLGQLSQEQRVAVIIQVADSLALAHSAGVIHKDIKPGNVLIDASSGQPNIRLSDFGSAALSPRQREALGLTAQSFTQTGNLGTRTAGTLMYMAPEVLAGSAPNVQADIYALGVMLYQMLAGDLTRPLSTGWENDVADALLRQDIADATQGNVQRRLATAREFAARLRELPERRKAAQELALAQRERLRAASMRRELRRLRVAAVALVLMLATATGAGIMVMRAKLDTEQARTEAVAARDVALAERERADRAAKTTRAVSDFMNDELLGGMQWSDDSTTISLKQMLDKVSARVEDRLGNHPDAAAEVLFVLGMRYGMNGHTETAQTLWDQALSIVVREYGDGSIETVRALHLNGLIRAISGDFDAALALFGKAVAILTAKRGPEHLMTLYERSQVAEAEMYAGNPLRALNELKDIARLAPHAAALDAEDAALFAKFEEGAEGSSAKAPLAKKLETVAHEKLGFLYNQLRKTAEAEFHLRQAIAGYQALYGADTRSTLEASANLVEVLARQHRYEEAEQLANAIETEMSGPASADNFAGLMILHRRAILRMQQGLFAEAESMLRKAWTICPNALQEGCFYSESRNIPEVLAQSLLAQKRFSEAEDILSQVLESREFQDGADSLWTVPVRISLALAQSHRSHTDALRTLKPVPAILDARLPGDFPMRREFESTYQASLRGSTAASGSADLLFQPQ